MRINLLQLLMALFLLENSLFGLADDKQSYIGEYAEKNNGKYTKVDFPRCRQIDSGLLVSQSGEWYFLSECDIEQSKFKSIRIWRAKLERGVGLKITGEIILPWRKIGQYDYRLLPCKRKNDDELDAEEVDTGGFIGFSATEPTKQNSLVYFALKDNGTIVKIAFSEIETCDMPESGE